MIHNIIGERELANLVVQLAPFHIQYICLSRFYFVFPDFTQAATLYRKSLIANILGLRVYRLALATAGSCQLLSSLSC